jgi:hypothetical protein
MYDLLIKNDILIDTHQNIEEKRDIAVYDLDGGVKIPRRERREPFSRKLLRPNAVVKGGEIISLT